MVKQWMFTVAAAVLLAAATVSAVQGGHRVSASEWPWFVYIGNCGGVLIGHDWVVTAAQCMHVHPTRVTLGSNQRNGAGGKVCTVQRVIVHPQWNRRTSSFDVALVKLNCHVTYTDTIRAIVLPRSTDRIRNLNGTAVNVAGFGRQEEGNHATPSVLHAATLYTVSASACANRYDVLDNSMMCAYADGKDSCQGDSGGPLVGYDNVLYGLVSYGRGCARTGMPGVYHYVPSSVQWIRSVTGIRDDENAESSEEPF